MKTSPEPATTSFCLIVDPGVPGFAYFQRAFTAGHTSVAFLPLGTSLNGKPLAAADLGAGADCQIWFVLRATTQLRADFLPANTAGVLNVSTGTDRHQINALAARGIYYSAAPGFNRDSVVQFVLGYLQRQNFFHTNGPPSRLVIIGAGRIGGQLLRLAETLGWQTAWLDPFQSGKDFPAGSRRLHTTDDILEFLREQPNTRSAVSFHVPLTRPGESNHPTADLVTPGFLRNLPETTYLLNTSRGPVFTPEAEEWARRRPHTLLDVFRVEPPPPLTGARAVQTPHIAGYSWRGRLRGVLAALRFFMLEVWQPRLGEKTERGLPKELLPFTDKNKTLNDLFEYYAAKIAPEFPVFPIWEASQRFAAGDADWYRKFKSLRSSFPAAGEWADYDPGELPEEFRGLE